jgi:TatD DNase family protein
MINLHTHHPTGAAGLFEITNHRWGEIALPAATQWRSVGLHPWWLPTDHIDTAIAWLQQEANQTDVLAIGEAGLDQVTTTDWNLQIQAFEACITVSEQVKKPLIIHCVRAYEAVLAIKKRLHPTQSWIIHGFDKHPQTAAMLLQAGCYLSFGAAILRADHHAAAALQACPAARFFLETDDWTGGDIAAVYAQAAAIRGEAVEQKMEENWQHVTRSIK